jgi:hypothetical protein
VNQPIRVVLCGTGNTGSVALDVILTTPALELVGVWAHNPDLAGRDAATVIGYSRPTGVTVWNDVESVLAAAPDCVCYMATDRGRRDDDWGFAIMASQDGPFKLTRDITGKPAFGDDEFPTRVDYVIDGQDWVWRAHPAGVMPGYAADPHYRPADGWCVRANETRSVVASFGWLDAFNDGRS